MKEKLIKISAILLISTVNASSFGSYSGSFLRMGTVGIVSQAYGRGDYREIVRTLFRNFIIAMVLSLIHI